MVIKLLIIFLLLDTFFYNSHGEIHAMASCVTFGTLA
jgi:hypothetical protein